MRPITMTVGPFVAANAALLRAAAAIVGAGSLTLLTNTLDTQRRIIFVSSGNDSGITFTITGTNNANAIQSEVVAGANAGTAVTLMSYKTVTSVVASGAAAGTVSIGTDGTAQSPWVRFDDWSPAPGDIQIDVSGTINYSVQFSDDDPNSPTNPVAPIAMTWLPTSDATLTAASTSIRSAFTVMPTFARILINSQTAPGSLTAVFRQAGSIAG